MDNNVSEQIANSKQGIRAVLANLPLMYRRLLLSRVLHVTVWTIHRAYVNLRNVLTKHLGLVIRAFLIFCASSAGALVAHFGGDDFTPEALSTYLISVSVMAGGTIAIVFAVSTFLLQGVADIYSSKYFESYVHDWRDIAVYSFVILITLFLLGVGLYVAGLSSIPTRLVDWLLPISMALVGSVFAAIDWHYRNIRRKLTPYAAIVFLQRKSVQFLTRLHRDAESIATALLSADGSLSREECLAIAYNRALQPFISDLNGQLDSLLMIAMKASEKQESPVTNHALMAYRNVIVKYLDIRSTSSLIVPSKTVPGALEGDSQDFLSQQFDRFNEAGEILMRQGKIGTVTQMIWLYHSLCVRASDMKFIGKFDENPIFDQALGYLKDLSTTGLRSNNIEVVFQGSRTFGSLANLAVRKNLTLSLRLIDRSLSEYVSFGISEKQSHIVNQCISAQLGIIGTLFAVEVHNREIEFKSMLSNISAITRQILGSIKLGRLPDDLTWQFALMKGYDEMPNIVNGIVRRLSEITDEHEQSVYLGDIDELFHEIYASLKVFSENTKDCDGIHIVSIGRLLLRVNKCLVELLEDSVSAHHESELHRRLSWNIMLPSWFAGHADSFIGDSLGFRQLGDSVAKTGVWVGNILCDKDLLLACVDCLTSLAQECLAKSRTKNGYSEIRPLLKACLLGIIAMKHGWSDVVTHLISKIRQFESAYFAKYFEKLRGDIDPVSHNVLGLPHSDQLSRELRAWRDNFIRDSRRERMSMRDSLESMLVGVITPEDVSSFITMAWEPQENQHELTSE